MKQNNINMKKKITRDTILNHLLEYQLSLIQKTLLDTLDNDNWRFDYTMTKEVHQSFKVYAINLIKKIFKCNKTKADKTFDWFNVEYGLRIKN